MRGQAWNFGAAAVLTPSQDQQDKKQLLAGLAEVRPDWAPHGTLRFLELANAGAARRESPMQRF